MIPTNQIKKQLNNTLEETDFTKLGKKYKGKVRDNYILGDKRIIITTDRISAFDRVLGTIPFKGQVLNQMTCFWFEKTKQIAKNHLIEDIDPNVVVAKQCKPMPVEMVVRGYITGVTKTSAWYNYNNGVRNFCGNLSPEGMKKDQRFDEPILTPSTKAEKGGHDESVSKKDILKRGIVSEDDFDTMEKASFSLFEFGSRLLEKQGLILVDTKYEFGKDNDENIVLIDEMHTPDSSRFWFLDTYEELFERGEEQRKLDKEYVRKWLADQGYLGDGEPPKLLDDVRIEAAKRYIKAYELITGMDFRVSKKTIMERIEKNLINVGYLKE